MINSKSHLRKQLLQQRRSLTTSQWREKSDRIGQKLQNIPKFSQKGCILAYFSLRKEPDLSTTFDLSGYSWGFPRIQGEYLSWHSWQRGERLEKNNYGILEPLADAPAILAKDVDLILVPGVACDPRGYRLGYGGGFYDRMLGSKEWQKIPTIGIIFDFALVEELPIEPWDQCLGGICTEERLILL
jgi:5-formyltetrahydrofolate cyclo-ligase